VIFPWPEESFTEQQVYPIDGTIKQGSARSFDRGARGPAVAEFREVDLDHPSYNYLARCRHHVHGQVTLISISPVIGNFQFACQFDATEYALVSGWFWE
jgi:hypothetical protein